MQKKVVNSLGEQCSENIDENEMVYNKTFNFLVSDYKCSSCTLYVVIFVVILVIGIIIGSVFIYFYWYSKNTSKSYC